MMSDTIKAKVLFFAKSRELADTSESTVDLPGKSTFKEIQRLLLTAYPRLNELNGCFVLALNEEYISEENGELTLTSDDVLAIIPPLSGG